MIGTELDFPIKSNTLKHGNEQLTSSLYSYDTRHVRVIKAKQTGLAKLSYIQLILSNVTFMYYIPFLTQKKLNYIKTNTHTRLSGHVNSKQICIHEIQ